MSTSKINPEWEYAQEMASAALVPHGRQVPLGQCPPGPYQFSGGVGWMSEYGGESYLVSGEYCCLDKTAMVQPLDLVLHTLETD